MRVLIQGELVKKVRTGGKLVKLVRLSAESATVREGKGPSRVESEVRPCLVLHGSKTLQDCLDDGEVAILRGKRKGR